MAGSSTVVGSNATATFVESQLAAAGWLTVRFTAARLRGDPDGVRRQVCAIIAARSPADAARESA